MVSSSKFRCLATIFVFILMALGAKVFAAPVEWSVDVKPTNATSGNIIVKAKVQKGYHFYAFAKDGGGATALTIDLEGNDGNIELGSISPSAKPVKTYVEVMEETLAYWDKDVSFTIPYKVLKDPGKTYKIKVRSQACNDVSCFSPQKDMLDVTLGTPGAVIEDPKATKETAAIKAQAEKDAKLAEKEAEKAAKAEVIEETLVEETLVDLPGAATDTISVVSLDSIDAKAAVPMVNMPSDSKLVDQWWEPVETNEQEQTSSDWTIFILGFLGGLAALLTPCVWPMIPMTLSFFLKKGKAQAKSRRDALIYGLSIIVIFLVLGLAITAIFGAGKLNELSTSALFNIFFFVLLVVFAISFFGAFDIKLPSKWSNAMDSKAESTTGFISIFFMAFTLVLVSFSCTGPIIGTLLVEAAAQGNMVGPALGMGGFALGLALPFSLFAIFPGMVKEMPKSGGWLNTVKVTLGFIELILSLKFLSVADMAYQWGILDREVFLVLWIVLFALLGMYLLGKIRFPHDDKSEHTGVFRFFLSVISFSFAVYLLPGLWGAPLKAVSAFVPPLETQDFNLYTHARDYIEFDNYDEGMAYAYEKNMPVLLDFSGYGCVNCRNMEVEVFDQSKVREFVADNFVMIRLMVDERTPISNPYTVMQNGKEMLIETEGERWTYLQTHKFGASSQPYYIILDNYGKAMGQPIFYTNNVDEFMGWMERGLQQYQNKQ